MSNAKILIIEDNGVYAQELKIHLQNLGYQVAGIVTTGEKAISELGRKKVDLILMDMKPRGELSGIEAVNQILLKYDIPVVYLTAFADQETVALAKKTEPYGFLSKPAEEIELQRTIELALYKHGIKSKLRKSEQRFKQISSSAYDGIILINEEGVINFWNEAAEKIFGYSAKEALNKNLYSLIAPRKYLKEFEKTFKAFISAKNDIGKGITIDLIAKKKDSAEIYIELSLSRCKEKNGYNAIAIIRDISEKKKTKEEQILLSTAIEQADESVLITDSNGLIQYVNPAFEKISGYARQEVIGKNPNICKSGKQDEAFYQKLWRTISQESVWKGRLVNRRKDGSLYTEEATISPVRNNLGKIVNFVAVKRDITTNLILEKKMRQTQNLQIMGLYANLFVHDFNNLLQPILIESDLLLEIIPEHSDIFSKIKLINNFANKAKDMAKQTLIFSRKEASIKKPLQIQTLIDDFFKIMETIKPPGVTIQLEIDSNCNPVLANPTQINQLLLNICTNAYHAMREKGGVLTLSLKKIAIDSTTAKKFYNLHQGSYLVSERKLLILRKLNEKTDA